MVDLARRKSHEARSQLALIRALARSDAGAAWSADRAILAVTKGGKLLVSAPARLVAALSSLGLLATDTTGVPALTVAGRAWLRRQLTSDDPFLAQHRDIHRRQIKGAGSATMTVTVNDAESPLAWLRRRKDGSGAALLDDTLFEAGERLRRDYTFAALIPRTTADWSNSGASSPHNRGASPAGAMRDDVIAAKQRVNRALSAVGPELGRILVDVCCLLKGIEAAEAGLGLPQRSGKVVLKLALAALARHYGISVQPPRQAAGSATLHWGSWDFRPAP